MELGAWLPGHVEDMLALPGFIEANTLDTEQDGNTRIHCVQYVLSSQQALDAYLENDAERMRADGVALFGDDLQASRAVRKVVVRSSDVKRCLNCNVELTGQYCWNCGQRGNTRLISIWELVRDAVGDLFELDSRLWRTLVPLVTRPGFLTVDYLQGRRARYMPPFRMYLVLSFIFFLIAQVSAGGPGIGLSIGEDGVQTYTPDDLQDIDIDIDDAIEDAIDAIGPDDPEAAKIAEEALLNLQAERATQQEALAAEAEDATDTEVETPPETNIDVLAAQEAERVREALQACNDLDFSINLPWGNEEDWDKQAREVCVDIYTDRGRRLAEQSIQALPIAAIAALPLLAMFLKFLYPLSRRYYVEHLLLLVHYHAFVFLALTLLGGLLAALGWVSAPPWVSTVITTITVLYIAIYLYKAMRRVYQKGRFMSIIKYFALFVGYIVITIIVFAFGAVILLLTY